MAQHWRKWFCAMMKVALREKHGANRAPMLVPEVAQPWRMAHLCCGCESWGSRLRVVRWARSNFSVNSRRKLLHKILGFTR